MNRLRIKKNGNTDMKKKAYNLLAFLMILPLPVRKGNCQSQNTDKLKPNIILFVSDDHGMDALGCYGNPVIKTPNLDRLSSEGVRFTNAYCTSASCSASRSVILTGKYGHATASYGHVHDYHHFSSYDNVMSLPVLLEDQGYVTARIGKYHVAPEEVYRFQTVLEANARSTYEMAEACASVLKSDKPFFLYFCTDDPHRGPDNESEDWTLPNKFGNRENGYPGISTVTYQPEEVIVPKFLPDNLECRKELAQYYQSVSRIDQGFGKLMQMLENSGKTDNTIVIYISDNGIAFPGAKTTVYEPGINLPCIIKDPKLDKKGIVNHAVITWVDLTPTILDMAGADVLKMVFHGKSFKQVLDQEDPEGWDEMFASHTFHEITMYYPMRVCRSGDYKLIWNIAWKLDYPFATDLWAASTWQRVYRDKLEYYGLRSINNYLHKPEFELFDLSSDPEELVNLASDEAYAQLLEDMKIKIRTFQKETQDPWIIKHAHD
jgi:N-sulfoglucosamine sulfohydrolase